MPVLLNRDVMKSVFTHFNGEYETGFKGAQSKIDKLATTVPSSTTEEDYGWLNDNATLREWIGDRQIQGLLLQGYTIKNRTFERTHAVGRDDIEDGKFVSRGLIFRMLGEDAAMHPDKLVFELLRDGHKNICYDGQYFFDTEHPDGNGGVVSNFFQGGTPTDPPKWALFDTTKAVRPFIFQKRRDYAMVAMDDATDEHVFMRNEFRYGVDARVNAGYGLWQLACAHGDSLNVTNFEQVRKQMQAIKKPNGEPMNITPNLLVVGPSSERGALLLQNNDQDTSGQANPYKGTFDLIVCPWLE